MPANGKVSVGWQIVFTFLPIVNLWAFYRIRKLRKYLLYVVVPSIAMSVAVLSYVLYDTPRYTQLGDDGLAFGNPYPIDAVTLNVLSGLVGWGLQAFAIYLVIIWTRQHNRHFQPDTQPLQ